MENKIIDYKLYNWDDSMVGKVMYKYKTFKLILITSDNSEIVTDYIEISKVSYNAIKSNNNNKMLELLNSIYTENIKLKILGSGYPIYKILYMLDASIDCVLVNFITQTKESKYTVKKFVTDIRLDKECELKIDNLELKHPIPLTSLGNTQKIHIQGIENITSLTESNINIISYTVKHDYNGILRLKYLDIFIFHGISKVYDIKEIILEDTCIVSNIPYETYDRLENLKEIVICKSVKKLGGKPMKDVLKHDENGYYIEVYKSMLNRLIRIKVRFN